MAGSKGGGTAKKSAGAAGGGAAVPVPPSIATAPPVPFTAEKNELPSPPPVEVTAQGVALSENLTTAEKNALNAYIGTDHKKMNLMLRGENPKMGAAEKARLQTRADQIDKAFEKSKLETPITLYRGTNPWELMPGGGVPAIGTVFTNKGFTSTSTSQDVASDIFKFNKGAVLKIHAPRGTPALDLIHHLKSSEKEVLLPRNTKFRVTGTKALPNGMTEVDVTVVR